MKNIASLSLAIIGLALASPAQAAVKVPKLPLACLPERAVKWIDGKPEHKQAPCHCPPLDMCPKTYAEYVNAKKAKMPATFILRCCPPISPPDQLCPDGKPIPPDGKCERPAACPKKYYPSLTETEIVGTNKRFTREHFIINKGRSFPFHQDCGMKLYGVFCMHGLTDYIYNSEYYGFSLRTSFNRMWVYYMFAPWVIQSIINYTGGEMPGTTNVEEFLPTIKGDDYAWFGISVGKKNLLPENLAHEDVEGAFARREVLDVGELLGGPLAGKNYAFSSGCRGVVGEYVTLHRQLHDGKNCPYLECRYVWQWLGESCLTGSAKVTLADGTTKPASEVTVGDVVKTATGSAKVTAQNQYRSGLRVLYGINGGEALLTGDHPIRTTDGWKVITQEAAKLYADKEGFAKTALAVGDTLITSGGEVKVTSIDRHAKVDPVSTYNIRIDGNAGFYADGYEVKGFDKMEMQYR